MPWLFMATSSLVTVSQYLSTSYRPDRDYVDGVVLERNLGEYDHARLPRRGARLFSCPPQEVGIRVVPKQRVQISPTCFRVPDICVVLGEPAEQIFKTPPFIGIEILSKDQHLSDMQDRVADYLNCGVLRLGHRPPHPQALALHPGRNL
jgi:Uma2 family endonuclease